MFNFSGKYLDVLHAVCWGFRLLSKVRKNKAQIGSKGARISTHHCSTPRTLWTSDTFLTAFNIFLMLSDPAPPLTSCAVL